MAAQPAQQRVYYPTKAKWARAKAQQLLQQAHDLRFKSSSGQYARASRKYEQIQILNREASRYESMAVRFEAKGL